MKVTVNGQTIEVPDGSSINVSNGEVTIAGRGYGKTDAKRITVEGNAGSVSSTNCRVEVKGDVQGSVTAGGSVTCGNVGADVSSGGSVTCGNIKGKVNAKGSIICGNIYNT